MKKVSDMTNGEVSRYLHERILGKCWHEFEEYRAIHGNDNCLKDCGVTRYDKDQLHMDYCSDESPRRLLNEIVAKLPTDLHEAFERALLDELGGLDYLEAWMAYSVATAEMISRACVEAWAAREDGE